MGNQAYIFDMDGVLVENCSYHVLAWPHIKERRINMVVKRIFSPLLIVSLCLATVMCAAESPCKGVELKSLALEKPRKMKAFVARIDLTTPGIGFTATERDPQWGEPMPDYTNRTVLISTKRERTADFLMRRRAEGLPVAIAVNSAPWGPWDCSAAYRSKYGSFRWWNVSGGVELSHGRNPGRGSFFLVYKDGRVDIASSVPPSRTNEVAFAFCGFGILMKNGAPVTSYIRRSAARTNPRTAFGLTADRRTLVLLVVDGRQPGWSLGADSGDLCDILRAEGVTDAVDMDGGGSSTLVVFDETTGKPRTLNRPSDKAGRRNALNVGIFFKNEKGSTDAR